MSREFKREQYWTRIGTGTLLGDQYTIFDISLNSSQNDKYFRQLCRINRNTLYIFNNFFSENRAVFKVIWKNVVEPDRSQMTIWRMDIACWIPKATNSTQNMQQLLLCHCNKVTVIRLSVTFIGKWHVLLF